MADSRYNKLDNQAPVQTALKADDVSVGRSAFDWSCIHNTNAIIGALIPVDCFDVVPNEDIDLSLSSLLEFRNPTTRQLFNGMRVFFHAYYNRLTDLWEGARNWLDNGRTGKINLTRPNLIYHVKRDSASPDYLEANACTPMSLLNYLGLPVEAIPKRSFARDITPLMYFTCAMKKSAQADFDFETISESPDFFPADCVMAYQRNWRDYYCNKNLLQNNTFWFPDNEEHFILSYDCENAVCINYGMEAGVSVQEQFDNLTWNYDNTVTPEANNPSSSTSSSIKPNLSGLKFRQFRGDRFTTALPFPDLIRGDIPVIKLTNDNFANLVTRQGDIVGYSHTAHLSNDTPDSPEYTLTDSHKGFLYTEGDFTKSESSDDLGINFDALGVTMSDIYTLETLTAFRRRMGMTNGDYNEMIKAQYGVNPNVHDRKGTYIGGFYQDFAFSSVTQNSESGSTPLGTKAGQGISSGSGSIGHFHTPDFGWIQIYMSIIPDVYYTQGVPKMFSKKNNLEMYFPIFNNLPAQAILNKELFVSGDTSVDNDVFAYEDRYAEYKSRHNRVSGLMALPVDKAPFDTARIIARRFESTPALNSLFVTMVPENVDMSVFSVSDEPPFDVSVGISCRRVFPAPYTAIEGSLSSPALVRG